MRHLSLLVPELGDDKSNAALDKVSANSCSGSPS